VLQVRGFDHVVLVVDDVERSLAWYGEALGLAGERVEAWRRGEVPFPSVRIDEGTVVDLVAGSRNGGRNVDHFCVVVEPVDFEAVKQSGRFRVVDGPAARWGARGVAPSLYVLDPDDNVVELRYYG
jgi:catechol 2,3-dioxygenase-like lactoylglutathione lyase family enzyme